MADGFGHEDASQIILVLKLLKDGGGGASHAITEIDTIAQVQGQCQDVDDHKYPATHALIGGCLLLMQGKQHHQHPQGIGIENRRGVKRQSTTQNLQEMTPREAVGKEIPVLKKKGHAGYEINHIDQKQITDNST